MNIFSKFSTPGVGFLFTLLFGFWLSKLGRPYNGILFNIHKLIALGTVIVTSMQIYGTFKASEVQALFILLMVVMGLCVVALFASGAFMSIGNLNQQTMLTVHRASLALGFIGMVLISYFLYRSSL